MNSLQLCLYLAGAEGKANGGSPAPGGLGAMESAYRELLGVMDRIQEVCRPVRLDPMSVPFALVVEDRVAAWQRRFAGREIAMLIRPPGDSDRCALDPMRLAHGLDELASWRLGARPAKVATSSASIVPADP